MISEGELVGLLQWFAKNPRLDTKWMPHNFGARTFGTIGGGEVQTRDAPEFFTWLLYAGTFRWNMYGGAKRLLLRQLMSTLQLMLEFPGDFSDTFGKTAAGKGSSRFGKVWWVVGDFCHRLLNAFSDSPPSSCVEPETLVEKFSVSVNESSR